MNRLRRFMLRSALAGLLAGASWLAVTPELYAQDPAPGTAPSANGGGEKRHPEGKAGKARKSGAKRTERPYPPPPQAWSVATLILGRPTHDRITLAIYPAADLEGYVEYGAEPHSFTIKTAPQFLAGKTSAQLTLAGLSGNTAYAYRLRYRKPGSGEFLAGPTCHFQSCRAPGSSFSFELQGDSHPERTPRQNDPVLYAQTLSAVAADRPDFFFCIGDDFSVDALPEVNKVYVESAYLKQLPYLGLVAHSAALFLVNGNHEQAARGNLNGTPDNVAVWAQTTRNALFPQPAPDGFYSGDPETVAHIGLLRDYYAWTWGDALFVVIDPYWHSPGAVDNLLGGGKKTRDGWENGLGDAQYQWLKKTLEGSAAKYKFVLAHHVNGTGRGGIENARLFEWGGQNRRGDEELEEKRPGWPLPIHSLLARNHVTIFFQGHDHVFARQELDGVTYQTLPNPADPSYTRYNKDAYLSGDIRPNSGRVRVRVAPDKITVEYLRSYLPADATPAHPDGETAFSYELSASRVPSGTLGAR